MPKLKTNRAAAKRFKVTKNGKMIGGKAGRRHLMTGKSANRRRRLRKASVLSDSERGHIKRLLPYS